MQCIATVSPGHYLRGCQSSRWKLKDLCFWSIGDGKYAAMLQTLVNSFHKVGMHEDFHAVSDRPIDGAITHIVPKINTKDPLYKFACLRDIMRNEEYRYFVFLDADSYFVHKPPDLLPLAKNVDLHVFLEGDCTSSKATRPKWYIPLPDYVKLMRAKGITSEKIYNVNSGFFIVSRDKIDLVYNTVAEFLKFATEQGYKITDEPALAYAMHVLTGVHEERLLRNNLHIWATDWFGVYAHRLPDDKPWTFIDFLTFEPVAEIQPAIIHCIGSKDMLAALGT